MKKEPMTIRQRIRVCFEKSFNLIGLDAHIRTKKDIYDWVIYDKKMLTRYMREDEDVALYREAITNTGMAWSDNFPKQQRLFELLQMVKCTLKKGTAGDFVECGCWWGHSTYMIAKLLQRNGFQGTFHVFDSFEGGLSEKTKEDVNLRYKLNAKQILEEKTQFMSTMAGVQQNLKDFPFIKYYKGWIPNRFPEVSDKNFAFVHIDVDLYQPTRDAVEFFYPRLLKSGCIVNDDYGLGAFDGCQTAIDEYMKNREIGMFWPKPLGGCVIIK